MNNLKPLSSKLPRVGTTIFTTMSALATETGAINLGQGFPDFGCDPALPDAVTAAMQAGHNQYPPMTGVLPLREAIVAKTLALYGRAYDPVSEVTVTAGATQAVMTAIQALVHAGDEVIVIEPAFDCYVPAILLAGAAPVFVSLNAIDFSVPWDKVEAAITPKTRLIMTNTPHNPTASVMSAADLQTLADLAEKHDLLVLSDEVYEHMAFVDETADGVSEPHQSAARNAQLAARSIIVSSFGKTFHVTGWKVGYVIAPAAIMAEFRKVHQFNVFTVNTPMQYGIATYMQNPAPYLGLAAFYQKKRDLFRAGLAKTPLILRPCAGTYFQVVDYSQVQTPAQNMSENDFALWMTREIGVVSIPMSAFYDTPVNQNTVRLCFAKKDETLNAALAKLQKLQSK